MNHVPLLPQTAPTWRDSIAQDEPARPRGRTGRTRLVLDAVRHWVGVCAAIASLIFGYAAWQAWRQNPAALAAPTSSALLREVVVRSDGVLDLAWAVEILAIPEGTGLMSLDLPALRDRLLAHPQVENAVVARRLPDVLVVTLEERSPVLRLQSLDSDGREQLLFVARDGVVYGGRNYDEALVSTLPWLAGVRLLRERTGAGFLPLDGMQAVSELLGTVRSSAPSLARDFQVLSLARYAADGVILVRMPEVAEVAFGSAEGFYPQIARLDFILDELRARGEGAAPIRSINLAVGGRQIPVAFEPPPAPEPRGARPASRPAPAPRPSAPTAAPVSDTRSPVPVFFRI